MSTSDREIMKTLEAFDLNRCAHSAAKLAGSDPKTVARYVPLRASGANPFVSRPLETASRQFRVRPCAFR